jgi:hypothetical protein
MQCCMRLLHGACSASLRPKSGLFEAPAGGCFAPCATLGAPHAAPMHLARHGLGQHRLAGAGRPVQQHALDGAPQQRADRVVLLQRAQHAQALREGAGTGPRGLRVPAVSCSRVAVWARSAGAAVTAARVNARPGPAPQARAPSPRLMSHLRRAHGRGLCLPPPANPLWAPTMSRLTDSRPPMSSRDTSMWWGFNTLAARSCRGGGTAWSVAWRGRCMSCSGFNGAAPAAGLGQHWRCERRRPSAVPPEAARRALHRLKLTSPAHLFILIQHQAAPQPLFQQLRLALGLRPVGGGRGKARPNSTAARRAASVLLEPCTGMGYSPPVSIPCGHDAKAPTPSTQPQTHGQTHLPALVAVGVHVGHRDLEGEHEAAQHHGCRRQLRSAIRGGQGV